MVNNVKFNVLVSLLHVWLLHYGSINSMHILRVKNATIVVFLGMYLQIQNHNVAGTKHANPLPCVGREST